MQGVRGVVRSGGDAGRARLAGPPPTEALVAFHSGIVAGRRRTARRTSPFHIPDFNGTVRLMAMAWTKEGVGHAEKDVLVRDPVVVTASLPHFLAPGDQSRLALDLDLGRRTCRRPSRCRSRRAARPSAVDPAFASTPIELAAGERQAGARADLGRRSVGDDVITVALTLPDGDGAGEDAEPRASG